VWEERNLGEAICKACQATSPNESMAMREDLLATKRKLVKTLAKYRDVIDGLVDLLAMIEENENDN
jgi:hypothetical protein